MEVSIIITCKNRLRYLQKTLPLVRNQDFKDMWECVVVDYNCPQKTKDWVDNAYAGTNIMASKAEVGAMEWSLSAARNFGFKQAKGKWILFIDADTCIQLGFISDCMNMIEENSFMTGNYDPDWNCCGCLFVNRADFLKVQGYNEALIGWGYEDIDIYERLEKSGLKHLRFNKSLISNTGHPTKLRNQYHNDKHPYATNENNHKIAKAQFRGL